MQFLTLVTLLVAGSATALANPLDKRSANEKANEYISTFVKLCLDNFVALSTKKCST